MAEGPVALKYLVSGKSALGTIRAAFSLAFCIEMVVLILAGHWDIFMGVYRNLFSTSGLQIPPWEQELLGKAYQFTCYTAIYGTHWESSG